MHDILMQMVYYVDNTDPREVFRMVRIFGKALLASWRPYESGGNSQIRSSQMQCESVTVIDQTVLAQHPDGFWESLPLSNCSIIWQGKPIVTVLLEDGTERPISITGKDHTLADELMSQESSKPMRFGIPTSALAGDIE
jgi:hypothetical protein